jgi:hypothetical protein
VQICRRGIGRFCGATRADTKYKFAVSADESEFDNTYVPEHLKEKVKNCENLSFRERFDLIAELSEVAWAKLGVVRDPNKPMDKTIRRVERKQS